MALLTACTTTTPAPTTTAAPAPTLALPGPTPTATPALMSPSPAPTPPPLATLAPVTQSDWSRGPEDARLQLVVYTDFQCPSCQQLAALYPDLEALHPDDLRLIYRPFPLLPLHDKASLAGQAAEAAGEQGAFWEMHDLLFARADSWTTLPVEDFVPWLAESAAELGLDRQAFARSLTQGDFEPRMRGAFTAGLAAGLTGTPTVFLNGRMLTLPPTLENLEASLRVAAKEYEGLPPGPPAALPSAEPWRARLLTTSGDVVVELWPESAPQAVASFIYLAQQGWYDDTIFHRVVPEILVESGDPTWTGLAGPAYRFETEVDPGLSFQEIGLVGLVSEGPGTNGAAFFVNLAPLPGMDGEFTIFGKVVDGLALLYDLPARDPLEDLLEPPPLRIERIEVAPSEP